MGRPRSSPISRSPLDLPAFTDATFVCFLASPPKFTPAGQLLFSLAVEADQVEAALDIRFLARDSLPLRCHLQVDTDILDAMADLARED